MKTITTESRVDLNNLSLEELQNVIIVAERLLKLKERELRENRKEIALNNLKVGDIVNVTGNKFEGELFEVLKCNPTKVKCKRENGEIWNIPYSHIII